MVDFCGVLLKPGRSAETAQRIVAGMLAQRDDKVFDCHARQIDDHLWLGFAAPKVFQHERARRGMITVRDGFACFGDVALYNRDRLNQPDAGEDDVSVLHRWLRRGGDLGIVNGDFGAGTYDLNQQKLSLFRDQTGVGAILHADHADGLVFGNHPRFFLGAGLANLDLDPVSMAAFIVMQYAGVNRHYLTGVTEIPLSHLKTAWPGRTDAASRYWTLSQSNNHGYKGQECIEHVREVFERAVLSRAEGAERIGVSLSGGLDSSSVAGVLASADPTKEILGFAHRPGLAPHERDLRDDGPYIDAVDRHWPNLKVDRVLSNDKDVFHGAEFWAQHALSPCHDTFYFGTAALEEAATAAGVDILLDGYSGDDTLSCWGDQVLFDALVSGKPGLALQEFKRLFNDGRRQPWANIKACLIRPLVPRKLMEWRERRRGTHWTQNSALRDEWLTDPRLRDVLIEGEFEDLLPPYTRVRDNMIGAASVSNSIGSAHQQRYVGNRGLRQRSPMMDVDLMIATYWTPIDLFVSPNRDRELIRSVCAPVLPEEVLKRPNKAKFVQDMSARFEQVLDKAPDLNLHPNNMVWSEIVDFKRWRGEISNAKGRELASPPPDFSSVFYLVYAPVMASRFANQMSAILADARS